nr:hypothetical protein [Tanacetum cinerariifolium]
KDGKWFHELALQNTGIESLDFRNGTIDAVKDLTLLAKNCSQSLVSLKIAGFDQVNLVDVFTYAVRLEDCFDIKWVEDQVDTGFKFPTIIGEFCKKLRKFKTDNRVTEMELITMVKGCLELECLHIHLKGESDAGLVELSKGCPKMRKLEMVDCPFSEQAIATYVFNIHSLGHVDAAIKLKKSWLLSKSLFFG